MPLTLRFALRSLLKNRGYAAGVLTLLSLGIAASSAVFSAVDQVVIRPLPYPDAERLSAIWEDFSSFGSPRQRVSPGTFFDWQRRSRAFSSLAAYRLSGFTATGSGHPESLRGIAATANLIPTLGVSPIEGRLFTDADDTPGSRVVVVSFAIWKRLLGGDRTAVGRTLRLNDEPYTVIGVMPASFHFPDAATDYWVPLGLAPEVAARRNSHFLFVIGRLRPDRTWAEASADMSAIAADLATIFPDAYARVGVAVVPLKNDVLQGAHGALFVLCGAGGGLLLIACSNAANLALVRGSRRRHEIAVRLALGASRARLARDMLVESALLAGGATGAGLVLASWSVAALQWLVPSGLAGSAPLQLDGRAVAFASAIAAGVAVLFALIPAVLTSREAILPSVSSSNPFVVAGSAARAREALIVLEIAIALVLLGSAGLLLKTLLRLQTVETGFRVDHVLTASIEVPYPKYVDPQKRRQFFEQVLEAASRIPGVASAGLTSDLPYTARGNTMSVRIEHQEHAPGLGRDALFRLVSPGYLRTIGARLIAGRLLDGNRDTSDAPAAVVVNESFRRKYFGDAAALGHRIDSGTGVAEPVWMTIVGVVADVRERGADQENRPAVYVPFTQTSIAFFQPSEIAIRTAVPPMSLADALRRAVWSVDVQQAVTRVRTLDDIVENDIADRRQVLTLVGAFSAVALLLAAVGLYGVLSYIVVQSRREIGIRLAIGASSGVIARGVFERAARLVMLGVVIGLLSATGATRLLGALLYGVSPLDTRVLGLVSATIVATAFAAAYVPARRAASTDPIDALRAD